MLFRYQVPVDQFLKHYITVINKILKKIVDIDKKISNTIGLVKNTNLNTKTTEIGGKISLVTITAFNAKVTEMKKIMLKH